MDRKLAVRLLIAAALFALTAALYYLTRPDTTSPGPTESPGTGTIIPAEQSREDTSAGPADRRGTLEDLRRQLQSGNAGLAELQALRARLLAAPPAEAVAEIEAFLATGQDAALRSDFEVGEGGTLAGAPSLRVFLLDLLGQIARGSGSDAAARIARGVLEKKTSPDEWAIAMRNVAWQEPRSKPYLAAKMREMLAHEPWTTSPSSGLLEAFDVIVYTADPAFIPELSQLRSKGVPDIERAAAVAMDRLSETAPLEVMNYLNSHPAEFADRPLVRADFYAKADLTVPAQRAAVETYLARGDVGLEEKTKLLGGLASPASFVSDNLLTPPPTPGDDLARLQNYASVLQQWQQQRRFPQLLGQMQALESRLRAQTR